MLTHRGKALRRITWLRVSFSLLLVFGFTALVHGEQADEAALSLSSAVQQALTTASGLTLAEFTIEEAEIGVEEAVIGRLAGKPESEIATATLALQEARSAYVDELVRIALEVEEAYFGVIRSEELLHIQKGSLEQADRQYAVAEARYKAGLISRQELLEAELSHAQSLVAMEKAERQVADARRQLARLMGAGEGNPFVLQDAFGFDPLRLSLEDAVAEAGVNRSEIKKAERALEQAQLQVIQADNPYTAPVTLRKAEMAARRAEIQLEQARLQVTDAIRRDWYALQDAEYNVSATRRSEELAQDRLVITEARFDAGMVSLIDLLRDQAAASQAELNAAGAVWDYNLSKARFLRSLGRSELPALPPEIAAYIAGWESQ